MLRSHDSSTKEVTPSFSSSSSVPINVKSDIMATRVNVCIAPQCLGHKLVDIFAFGVITHIEG